MNKKVRVRFAPSPTGGLHLGGVRTVLYNYLFAKQHHGDFVLRIEDTDQTRYVSGAEKYIYDTLNWCGLKPDESPRVGGNFGPYKQSERMPIYRDYAERLVKDGKAYYAFDSPEELDIKRKSTPNFQYNIASRAEMKNSLILDESTVNDLLEDNAPHVIRILMPENEEIKFSDLVRGDVSFNTSQVDDKVLLKADGMPTYHLAVVVDDYLMQISHAFRGEEWLPSAPVHVLLWKYLFGLENMPRWAHLPLILKPDGNGKLSKRDGDRLGFPVFALEWTDPGTNERTTGFKEIGFLSEAFINMLALLGWNDGTEQEIFSLPELIEKFSIERVHKGGAKFNYEKAKWINHEWIKKAGVGRYESEIKSLLEQKGIAIPDEIKFKQVLTLVRDRCTLLPDFVDQSAFFFKSPESIDTAAILPKWDEKKNQFFIELLSALEFIQQWEMDRLEKEFKEIAAASQIKPGEVLLPFRIMLVGGKFGPGVFDIAAILGKEETITRIKNTLSLLRK
jgi:glutamyl-tRNA synthetase